MLNHKPWADFPQLIHPSTRIEYSIPRPGHLTRKIFNDRGELVKTLIDEPVEFSGSIEWGGTNNGGARVGSGVYFCRAQADGQVKVQKLAIIK
jgi:hypothetical protein